MRKFTILLTINSFLLVGCSPDISSDSPCARITEDIVIHTSSKTIDVVSTVIKAPINARVLKRLKKEDGATTHMLLETQDGTKGWFAVDFAKFSPFNSNKCW